MSNVWKICYVCWKLNYFKRVCCSVRPRIPSQRKNTKPSSSNPKVELTKQQLITPLTKTVEEPKEKSSKEEIYCTNLNKLSRGGTENCHGCQMQCHKTKCIEKSKMRTKDRQTKVSKINSLWG